jgi:hypothetical protein
MQTHQQTHLLLAADLIKRGDLMAIISQTLPFISYKFIGRADKTFMDCHWHATKWTLVKKVFRKSEANKGMHHQWDLNWAGLCPPDCPLPK